MKTTYTVHYRRSGNSASFTIDGDTASYSTYRKYLYLMDHGIDYTISRAPRGGETEDWSALIFEKSGPKTTYPFLVVPVKIIRPVSL